MKTPSEVIPKFIISLDKDKERAEYLKNEVFTKITNYIKCKAFDGENDDPNPVLEENKLLLADHFIQKCNAGQLGCYLSHFQVWKYIVSNNLDLALVLEDDVKLYKNFNRIINTVYDNLPAKFDYVHLFIHPDKQKLEYLTANEGDIIPAEDNFGTVAYLISLRGARRLIKLTQLLKIQAPVDRQINFYIQHNFLRAFMIKKPFLITQGEIMPNRAIYNNSFKSNIWYSKKLSETNKINPKLIKPAGFSEDELLALDREIDVNKKNNQEVEEKQINLENEAVVVENDQEVDLTGKSVENLSEKKDEEEIQIVIPKTESVDSVQEQMKKDDNEEDKIVSSIIEKLSSID